MKKTPLKKSNKKTREKRKKDREDYPEFYFNHIELIRNNSECCKECGTRLLGDVSEVAHILPKGSFPSIATEDLNIIYLCGWKQNNCHSNFDTSSNESFRAMKVFPEVSKTFEQLKSLVEEKINYKTEDRLGWQN